MDIKDLLKLISRISFTGPGGIEKIVKILKELVEKLNTVVTEEEIGEILSSYYTKEEVQTILNGYVTDTQIEAYYTKEQVNLIISALGKNSYRVAWDGSTQPIVANIPAGVVVTYNNTDYTGTLSANTDTINSIYLVGQDMYVTSKDGNIYSWVFAGTTELELKDYATKEEISQLQQELTDIYGDYIENPEYIRVYTDAEGKILWAIKEDGTILTAAGIEVRGDITTAGERATLVDNQEFVYVRTDKFGKILYGVQKNGNIIFGCGVPSQIVSYVKERIESLHLDDYQEIESFLGTLINGDNLATLLGGKVDKEDGKSLINEVYAESVETIENPEFIEVKTDKQGRILSYRDNDGVLHEMAGLFAKDIELGKEGRESLINLVKEKYPNPNIWSDKEYLELPMPRCAVMNITNIYDMPTTKTDDLQAVFEVWDMQGNYFKKTGIVNAQGNSSLGFAKKNFAVDFLNGEWDEDSSFTLKLGKWVPQDSFHFKAYYTDFFVGVPVIGYRFYNEMVLTRGIYSDRTWKRAMLPTEQEIGTITGGMADYPYNLCLDSGARCFPDGFPVIVHLNGEFYGIFCWQLKKHRDNYHQKKDNGGHIHLDGNISSTLLWSANGVIDWYKWAGITNESESSLNHDGIEIRNPKDLVLRDGDKYDHDTISTYPSTVDVKSIEIVGEDDPEYSTLMAEAEAISDAKKRAKRIAQLRYTAAVKDSILNLSKVLTELSTAEATQTADGMRSLIRSYMDVDSMIDYQIFCDLTNNVDGIKKNWQWTTWDGNRWAVNPYDLDGIFGLYGADGSADQQPRINHIGNVSDNPCYWVLKYFNAELEARYAELRRARIIDAEHLASELNDWTLIVGLHNYELEKEKWPERRNDNIYRFRNWCIESVSNMDTVYHYSE